jgi:tRNA1(Val) A37 N6-methylase TrmN6
VSDTSAGWLLGGKVRYRQPRDGFRSGIEPVLLAAAVPVRPGEPVLEAGTGGGAGLLCLAARVPGICGAGVERDPRLAALARENLAANGFHGIVVLEEDIEALAEREKFAHAFANPPWHEAAGTPPAHPGRVGAKRGGERLAGWIAALARRLAPRGTLTLVLPAARLADALAAMAEAGCGSVALFPLWPRLGSPAKLVLLRSIEGGRGPLTLLAGLVLHGPDGRFTAEAEAVLRGGAALALAPPRPSRLSRPRAPCA